MNDIVKRDNSPVARLKNALNSQSVKQQFENALKENANLFVASLIDLYANDNYLQKCEPKLVIMEALKAATLKLPINKALGFYYIIPFKDGKSGKNGEPVRYIPTGVIGYKGYLQLAQRTGQYKFINADIVYEGEQVIMDRLTGELIFSGAPSSEKAIGYFAYIETVNGFKKAVFWDRKKIDKHAQTYSKSYNQPYGPWKKEFDAMAIKTVLRHILTRFGVMSVDMISAISYDSSDYKDRPAMLPQGEEKPVGAEYETRMPPPTPEPTFEQTSIETPPEKPQEQGAGAGNNAFRKDEGVSTGQGQPDQIDDFIPSTMVDELGTPENSPFELSKWKHSRVGKPDKTTGFAKYVKDNAKRLMDVTDRGWSMIVDKWANFYNEDFPFDRQGNEIGPDSDIANEISNDIARRMSNDDQERLQDTMALLDTPAAKQLAEIAKKHPIEYTKVVAGQVPESIEQILNWLDQINEMVVESKKNQ